MAKLEIVGFPGYEYDTETKEVKNLKTGRTIGGKKGQRQVTLTRKGKSQYKATKARLEWAATHGVDPTMLPSGAGIYRDRNGEITVGTRGTASAEAMERRKAQPRDVVGIYKKLKETCRQAIDALERNDKAWIVNEMREREEICRKVCCSYGITSEEKQKDIFMNVADTIETAFNSHRVAVCNLDFLVMKTTRTYVFARRREARRLLHIPPR